MERLQKVMAHAGVASRRKCEQMILDGKVTVNGKLVTELGTKVSSSDLVEVEGLPIYKEEPRYILLYKPKNVISAVTDDRGRDVVLDYIHGIDERIFPVGRLDFDTTGLMVLTNDGEFANLLMHPRHEIDKVYIAKVEGIPTEEKIKKLSSGVIVDRKMTSPAKAKILNVNNKQKTAIVELKIHEGWNHQVKKMFEAIGHNVIKLKRERFSFLDLGTMNPGDWRELTAFEVDKLRKIAESN